MGFFAKGREESGTRGGRVGGGTRECGMGGGVGVSLRVRTQGTRRRRRKWFSRGQWGWARGRWVLVQYVYSRRQGIGIAVMK